MFVSICVCIYVYTYVCMCLCVCTSMYVCVYVFTYIMWWRNAQCSAQVQSSLSTFHYRPLIHLYNKRLEPSILSPVRIHWRFYTVFMGRLMEGTQYNTERFMRPFLCIVDLVLALDTICWLVMIAYVGPACVWKMDSSSTVKVFCQLYLFRKYKRSRLFWCK